MKMKCSISGNASSQSLPSIFRHCGVLLSVALIATALIVGAQEDRSSKSAATNLNAIAPVHLSSPINAEALRAPATDAVAPGVRNNANTPAATAGHAIHGPAGDETAARVR